MGSRWTIIDVIDRGTIIDVVDHSSMCQNTRKQSKESYHIVLLNEYQGMVVLITLQAYWIDICSDAF